MDSIGDYIYLIVIIVAGISSIFKNKNKDKNTTPKPKSAESEDLGEVLREIFSPKPEKKPEVIYQKPVTEIKKTAFETIESYENTTNISNLKAKKEITRPISSNLHVTIQPEIAESTEYSINSIEEARAAFISAEIFTRKY